MFDLLENSHLEINVTHNKTNIIMEFENQLDEKKEKKMKASSASKCAEW